MLKHKVDPDRLILEKYPVIYHFVILGKDRQVDILLKYGASPNLLTDGTMLGMAVFKRRNTILRMLLDHGGNPNLIDRHGNTPLHDATYHNAYDGAQILLQKGADPDIPNAKGESARMVAIRHNDQKMIDLIESYTLDIKEPDGT
jgi:ankyrin repeat protein